MAKLTNGKYRLVVSLTPAEYEKLRRMAFDNEVTVNELLRVVTVRAAEEYITGR